MGGEGEGIEGSRKELPINAIIKKEKLNERKKGQHTKRSEVFCSFFSVRVVNLLVSRCPSFHSTRLKYAQAFRCQNRRPQPRPQRRTGNLRLFPLSTSSSISFLPLEQRIGVLVKNMFIYYMHGNLSLSLPPSLPPSDLINPKAFTHPTLVKWLMPATYSHQGHGSCSGTDSQAPYYMHESPPSLPPSLKPNHPRASTHPAPIRWFTPATYSRQGHESCSGTGSQTPVYPFACSRSTSRL